MNDAMFKAYNQGKHRADAQGTLFEALDWRSYRYFVTDVPVDLKTAILETVRSKPGHSRKRVWADIVEQYFMAFDSTEYRRAVRTLVGAGALRFEDKRGTGELNDESPLYVAAGDNV